MKNRSKLIAAVALAAAMGVAVAGCMATQSDIAAMGDALPDYGLITPQQAVDVVLALKDDPAFVLLDIRTPAEVDAGHISRAAELDFYSTSFRDDLAVFDRDLIYLIYCRTGNRTGQTMSIMDELGFENVYDLGGGISQWMAAGFPVCVGPLDAEHTCSAELLQSRQGFVIQLILHADGSIPTHV